MFYLIVNVMYYKYALTVSEDYVDNILFAHLNY